MGDLTAPETAGPVPPSHRATLKLTALYAVGNVGRRGVHLALLPVYTAFLPTSDFGVIALLTVAGGVLSVLIANPLIDALRRFYYHPDYRRRQGLLLFNVLALLLATTLLAAAAWLALAGRIAPVLLGRSALPEPAGVVRLYTLVLVLWPISLFAIIFVKLIAMARLHLFLSLSSAGVTAAVVVAGLLWLDQGLRALIWGHAAGMAFVSLGSLPVLVRHCRWRLSPSVLRQPLRFGYPLMPTGLSMLIMQLGDRYVLRLFLPLGSVGQYSLGYSIAEGIDTAVGTPVWDAVNPVIRKLEDRPDEQRRFIRESAGMYYVLTLFVALAVALFSRELVMLLARRAEYWPAWVVVPVVALAFAQIALGSFLDWGLVMRQKAWHMSSILILSAAANIALNVVLIPRYGIMGAAGATLASYVLWNALKVHYSAKFYDLRFDLRRLGQATGLAVGLYLLSLAAQAGLGTWAAVPVKALLAAAFPVLCYATGVLDAAQRQGVRRLWRNLRAGGVPAAVRGLAGPPGDRPGGDENTA